MGTEFWGIGRTWLVAILILVATSVLTGMGVLDIDSWKEMVKWVFTVAGGKSLAVGVAGKIKGTG